MPWHWPHNFLVHVYMHLYSRVPYHGGMDQSGLRLHEPRQIGEEEISEAAPKVRALVLERLELIWGQVEPHLHRDPDEKPDVRFLEAGIRVLDRLSRLYRLDSPATQATSDAPVVDAKALVMSQLAEIAARQA